MDGSWDGIYCSRITISNFCTHNCEMDVHLDWHCRDHGRALTGSEKALLVSVNYVPFYSTVSEGGGHHEPR